MQFRPWRRSGPSAIAAVLAVAAAWAPPAAGPVVAAEPDLGPELAVSDPVFGRPPGGRDAADTVATAGGFLSVWRDFRTFETSDTEIYASRIDLDGTLLDRAGIRVTSAPGAQLEPQVAWNGEEALVVWEDYRNQANGNAALDIYGARVAANGTVLDPEGVAIATGADSQWRPDVAWNGSAWVVAWVHNMGGAADVHVARLTPDLQRLGPAAVTLADGPYGQYDVRLAVDGTTTVAVFTDERDTDAGLGRNVYTRRLAADGEVLGEPSPIRAAQGDQSASDVAATGHGLLVTWSDYLGPGISNPIARGQRLAVGGALSGSAIDLALGAIRPRVAGLSSSWVVAWDENDANIDADIMARTVNPNGVTGTPFELTNELESENIAALAGDGDLLFALASERTYSGGAGLDIVGVRAVAGDALDDPPLRLSTAAREQLAPTIVQHGSGWSAVWAEHDRATGWDVYHREYLADGTPAGAAPQLVAGGPGDQRNPAAASNGTSVLVAWYQPEHPSTGRIQARRLGSSTEPAGPVIPVDTTVRDGMLSVASDGQGFAVLWGRTASTSVDDVYVQGFDADGGAIDALHRLGKSHGNRINVAPLGGGYLATWSTSVSEVASTRIVAKRLSATAAPIDEQPITVSASVAPNFDDGPSVASSGPQALVTWIERPAGRIRAARVTENGAVLDAPGITVLDSPNPASDATVAWNGVTYLVAWWDAWQPALHGAEVNRLGMVVSRSQLAAVQPYPGSGPPRMASGTGGRLTVAYSRVVLPPPAGASRRAFLRIVDVSHPAVTGQSVQVAAGAAATAQRTVTVSTPASGAVAVQLSNDGVTWTSRPYAATHAWSLTPGDGVKTVRVRWADAAGTWTAPLVDSIQLDTVAPTITSPVQVFTPGTAITGGKVPTRFVWSASDALSGVVRYELRQRIGTGAWTTVNANLTRPSATLNLTSGQTYRYAVRAWDRAGNGSPYAYGTTFTLSGVSEASNAVRYTGTWGTALASGYWGGRVRYATSASARATFTFTGRSVGFVTTMASARGRAAIYVNGAYATTIDLHSSTWRNGVVAWSHSWSTSAQRTVEIRVLGTAGRPRVDLDGWVVGS